MEMKTITLTGGAYFVTPKREDAYRVAAGSIYVYIVPWRKGEVGRRSLLCQMNEGEMIPAFCYRDMDYQQWRFCLVAVEEAMVSCMEGMCTGPLRKRFLTRAQVENPGQESFENALVNQYRMNLVREDGYLIRTGMDKEEIKAHTDRLITSFFVKEDGEVPKDEGHAIYQVTAELCKKRGIKIAPYERIADCCGPEFGYADMARISHFPCREVVLEEKWYEEDAGALLVSFGEDMEPAACIPRGQQGYLLYRNGKKTVKLTEELAEKCDPKAFMVYRPFPNEAMTAKRFFKYCVEGLSRADMVSLVFLTVISSLIGLLIPTLNQKLYDQFIPMGEGGLIIQIGCLIGAFMIGNLAFSLVKNIAFFRLTSHIQCEVQNAVYYRIFELPENFFRKYESADLAVRVMELGVLASQVAEMILSLGLSLVASVFYLVRMFSYSVTLSIASLIMSVLFAGLVYVLASKQMKYQKQAMELDGKSDSKMFQFIMGIEKIRIAGIEERAIYEYLKEFVKQRQVTTDMARFSNVSDAIRSVSSSVFTMVLFGLAYQSSGLTMGEFVGFNSAFGMVSAAITGVTGALVTYKMLKPAYERVKDVLETAPEANEAKRLPGQMSGSIDLDHVAFAYGEGALMIFHDLSLHIKAGEYVGLVGSSGCGKSTLLKLLLGFEKPVSGKIYYDNQDMEELDLQELRKKFGVVLQDGELISGSIYENITLTAVNASYDDVERVVEEVGLTEDIEEMPMGLQTVVTEHCGTISGGQKQRILIARALINQPKVIFFDEATSALDNVTQAQVCDTLEKMDSTRIVIAHRLSTIRNCDRILVLDQGNIVEEGDYETLMEKKGMFWELARRQIL